MADSVEPQHFFGAGAENFLVTPFFMVNVGKKKHEHF
jgi:hypothetical protein